MRSMTAMASFNTNCICICHLYDIMLALYISNPVSSYRNVKMRSVCLIRYTHYLLIVVPMLVPTYLRNV